MEKYKILWTDMHSNLHHFQIKELPKWIDHVKKLMDFWPVVYYPYFMRKNENGLPVEDLHDLEDIKKDWEIIRALTEQENVSGYPMFMAYEWQGSGEDGDHNVFFKDNHFNPEFPLRYQDLKQKYSGEDIIAIPHHLAYQLGYRGKNWDTHDDKFSPFVETYSSHGSSENDSTSIGMERHIHMGPRTGRTSAEEGYNQGYKYGLIASGDNHACPGVYGFGYAAVLAKSNSKEDIWDAFVNRRVYGVSKDRIKIDYRIDETIMGASISESENSRLTLNIEASNAIDRIEILKDNLCVAMIPHTSQWEAKELNGVIRFKFQLDLGWGPDRRIFEDIESKAWHGVLYTPGKLISIEKCWSNFGQEITNITENSCEFNLTSYKTTSSGKWMGPSAITNEGFIFEIEDDISSKITLTLDGQGYCFSIKDILENSIVTPLMELTNDLLLTRYNFDNFYRFDSWWHNSYKFKIHKAAPEISYKRAIEYNIDTRGAHQVRVRVWQKNGSVAWSSPVFIER